MKNKLNRKLTRKKVLVISTAVLAAALMINVSLSFLVSENYRDNVFSLGNVKLLLTEENFPENEESRIMVPAGIISKDPKVTNTGNTDEYVFLKITVPLCEAKLVDENDKIDSSGRIYREIFNFISDKDDKETLSAQTGFVFSDVGSFQHDRKWTLIRSEENETEHTHTYLFGYSELLKGSQNKETTTLFDRIQMRNLLEGELPLNVEQTISVTAYGIQSEELLNHITIGQPDALTQEELTSIFVLYEKAGGTI